MCRIPPSTQTEKSLDTYLKKCPDFFDLHWTPISETLQAFLKKYPEIFGKCPVLWEANFYTSTCNIYVQMGITLTSCVLMKRSLPLSVTGTRLHTFTLEL